MIKMVKPVFKITPNIGIIWVMDEAIKLEFSIVNKEW